MSALNSQVQWWVNLKIAVKRRLEHSGALYQALNLVTSVVESDHKVFALNEAFLFPKYGITGLNVHQHATLKRLADFVGTRSVDVVDVGANTGWFVRIAPRFFDVRRIYAYEPLVRYNAFLEACAKRHADLVIRNVLLGAESGTKVFYEYEDGGISSTRKFDAEFEAPMESRNLLINSAALPETSLDVDLVALEKDSSLPVLLKVDTQGSELEVLNGSKKLFESGRVIAVLIEIQSQPVYEDQALWLDVVKFLEDRGFVLLDIAPIQRRPDQTVTELDAVFVKRDRKQKHA